MVKSCKPPYCTQASSSKTVQALLKVLLSVFLFHVHVARATYRWLDTTLLLARSFQEPDGPPADAAFALAFGFGLLWLSSPLADLELCL